MPASASREVDSLIAIAQRMAERDPEEWPHALLMLGDQVYADEVSPAVKEFINERRDPEVPPYETVATARELLEAGRPFSAHEVLEARWKDAPALERDLWQGLAQLCVGLTHSARGNHTGAARLVERAAGRLDQYAATNGPTYGVDLAQAVECAWARVRQGR